MSIVPTSLNHVLRIPLAAEVHSRPSMRLQGPETLTHLAVYPRSGSQDEPLDAPRQHELLANLCRYFGVTGPSQDARYYFHDFGHFRLQWEAHTEFCTYTFAERHEAELPLDSAFDQVPLRHIPEGWLAGLSGMVMVATHVLMQKMDGGQPGGDQAGGPGQRCDLGSLRSVFGANLMVGCDSQGFARIWTDFAIAPDGFGRVIIEDIDMQYQQAGRLVQRVLEIETYRMMALLGWPHAQQSSPILNAIEAELTDLSAAMTEAAESPDETFSEERELLDKITALAARMEKLALDNSYRFAASKAYYRLVLARIDELREARIPGCPTIREFMDRRLAPAMNTCESTVRRQEELAERIGRTNDLLRTRVGIVQEQQNRRILESMNTRAAMQLRLQQAVEGLSVVAISYYSIGLVSYAGKAAKAAGVPLNPDVATGIAVPVVLGLVWLSLRRMHHHMTGKYRAEARGGRRIH
jgi:uncharacterized membrane-anchored protein